MTSPRVVAGRCMERLIPETVYERLPSGLSLAGVYSQVVSAQGSRQVHVAGTVPGDTAGDLVGEDDMAAQASQVVENIERSLAAADAGLGDVVRLTVFTTDVDRYAAEGSSTVAAAFEPTGLPAASLIGVERLAAPEYLLEIEATAVVE